jgi:hypothetical protein
MNLEFFVLPLSKIIVGLVAKGKITKIAGILPNLDDYF